VSIPITGALAIEVEAPSCERASREALSKYLNGYYCDEDAEWDYDPGVKITAKEVPDEK